MKTALIAIAIWIIVDFLFIGIPLAVAELRKKVPKKKREESQN